MNLRRTMNGRTRNVSLQNQVILLFYTNQKGRAHSCDSHCSRIVQYAVSEICSCGHIRSRRQFRAFP
ncbi:unnamed protein product, partial [Mesorhabditis belari]|uniref:Uncharacterized protein n=1 Tax=Mesorhabditis belari TaxID=2138241 RepID=A0AAF3FIC1_9BILA